MADFVHNGSDCLTVVSLDSSVKHRVGRWPEG